MPKAETAPAGAVAFTWNRDAYWASLEARFAELRSGDCATIVPAARREHARVESLLARLHPDGVPPGSPLLDSLERRFFELAPAACRYRTGAASTIGAHIEHGVSISTADEYLRDKKLRIMVLRLRRDLPELRADSLLPHRAAVRALERARSEHVPYDFTMDYTDSSRLFCSEVATSVYRDLGVTLWTGLSTISAPGLRRWLASFGVRHFETQEPSDLEYDPKLVVVAEWRDPASLAADHLDNAVVDAMLEGAEQGDDLTFAWYRLPLARLAKAYSWVMLRTGRTGPIPEGMSAAAALRNQEFSARQRRIADMVRVRAEEHRRAKGYPLPYWILLPFAREAGRLTR